MLASGNRARGSEGGEHSNGKGEDRKSKEGGEGEEEQETRSAEGDEGESRHPIAFCLFYRGGRPATCDLRRSSRSAPLPDSLSDGNLAIADLHPRIRIRVPRLLSLAQTNTVTHSHSPADESCVVARWRRVGMWTRGRARMPVRGTRYWTDTRVSVRGRGARQGRVRAGWAACGGGWRPSRCVVGHR